MRYARLDEDNERVAEVKEFDSIEGRFSPELVWVEASEYVEPGYRYDHDTGEFREPPEYVVILEDDNRVTTVIENYTLPMEPDMVEVDSVPDADDIQGYDLVRYYYPETSSWEIKHEKTIQSSVDREVIRPHTIEAVADSITTLRNAESDEDYRHAVDETLSHLWHVLSGIEIPSDDEQ